MIHNTFFKPVAILLAVAIPAWFIARSAFKKKTTGIDITFSRELLLFTFFLYIIAIAAITIVPLSYSVHRAPEEHDINLIPFKTTYNYVRHEVRTQHWHPGLLMENTLGNILMFIPFGFLLPMVIKKINTFTKVLFAGFVFSALIESIQYAERSFGVYRSVDVDDVILNTAGALTGWMILCGLRWFGGLFQDK